MRLLTALAEPFTAGDPMRLADPAGPEELPGRRPRPRPGAEPDPGRRGLPGRLGDRRRVTDLPGHRRHPDPGRREHDRCPRTHPARPGRGPLDRGKARVIADHCQPLTVEHTTAVQHLVLPAAAGLTTSELRDVTGQAVITVDPRRRRGTAPGRRRPPRTRRCSAHPDAMAIAERVPARRRRGEDLPDQRPARHRHRRHPRRHPRHRRPPRRRPRRHRRPPAHPRLPRPHPLPRPGTSPHPRHRRAPRQRRHRTTDTDEHPATTPPAPPTPTAPMASPAPRPAGAEATPTPAPPRPRARSAPITPTTKRRPQRSRPQRSRPPNDPDHNADHNDPTTTCRRRRGPHRPRCHRRRGQ